MIQNLIPEVLAKIEELFPRDGVYAVENPSGAGLVHRIVRIRDGIVRDDHFPAQHKHEYFSFFEFHRRDLSCLKAVRLDSFTNPEQAAPTRFSP